jgi:NADH-quinone oxidoreductase subunit G
VARLKPRFNEDVNRWWLCDEGRYGYGFVDDPSRLAMPVRRDADGTRELSWADALAAAGELMGRGDLGIIASPKLANEDLFALRTLAERRGIARVPFQVPPREPGYEDDFLVRADKNPNTRGAELIGFEGAVQAVLGAASARRLRCLLIFDHDLFDGALAEADVRAALEATETVIFVGSNANRTSERAHLVLPAAAWVERDGTFTNFEGRVQRFRPALAPLGESLPGWDIIGRLIAIGGDAPTATRAEHWFRALAASVPAFGGMTYQAIADQGAMVTSAVTA